MLESSFYDYRALETQKVLHISNMWNYEMLRIGRVEWIGIYGFLLPVCYF